MCLAIFTWEEDHYRRDVAENRDEAGDPKQTSTHFPTAPRACLCPKSWELHTVVMTHSHGAILFVFSGYFLWNYWTALRSSEIIDPNLRPINQEGYRAAGAAGKPYPLQMIKLVGVGESSMFFCY
jgi:hypothetical protein